MPLIEAMATVQPAGTAAAAARSRAALKELWRRLPAMPMIVVMTSPILLCDRQRGRRDQRHLPQWPGAPAGSSRALAHVPGRHRIDLFGPAPLQRVAHIELQPPDPLDINDGMLAVLERPDAL